MAYTDRPGGGHRPLWMGLIVVAVTVGGLGWYIASLFDPENLKPRFVRAVHDATGRTLTIAGPVGIKLSLIPTITLEDVTLSNPAGFSRAAMLTVKRVELTLALAPLIDRRVEVAHVSLVRPDLLLETDREGRGNWVVRHDAAAADRLREGTSQGAGQGGGGYAVSVTDIRVEDGQIGWLAGQTGRHLSATVPKLTLDAPDGAPMTAAGAALIEGRLVTLKLETGALDQLRVANEAATWPVQLDLTAAGATLTLQGRIARPLEGKGYTLEVNSKIPDPAILAPLFPGVPLTAMKNIAMRADIRDSGGGTPVAPGLELKIGSSDLGAVVAGARIEDLTLTARAGQPMRILARLALPGLDSGISGTVGDLAWLLDGASGPLAVDLAWNAASARATLTGQIHRPLALAGYGFDVTVNMPNPALLTERAPVALKAVSLQTRLTDTPGPVAFQMASSAGDLAGEVELTMRPRPSIAGTVTSKRLNLDMLRVRAAPDGPASGGKETDAQARRDKTAPLFSDAPLPFDALRSADARLSFAFGSVRLGGTDINGIDAALSLKDGVARLDPFAIAGADQRLNASLEVDSAAAPPRLHLVLRAPAIAVRPLLELTGLPPAVTAPAEIKADLTAAGASVKALAGSLTGWAGIAVKDGQLDARTVNGWLEQLRPLRIEGGDNTELRCFAVRMDAKDGIAAIQPVALNTAALIVEGNGDIDLGHETVNLRLRPRTRIGGAGVAVPLVVTGPLRAPGAKIDLSTAGGGGLPVGLLLGGKDIMGVAGGGDPCPAALARVSAAAPPAEGQK